MSVLRHKFSLKINIIPKVENVNVTQNKVKNHFFVLRYTHRKKLNMVEDHSLAMKIKYPLAPFWLSSLLQFVEHMRTWFALFQL
jgi:hypothetical protein